MSQNPAARQQSQGKEPGPASAAAAAQPASQPAQDAVKPAGSAAAQAPQEGQQQPQQQPQQPQQQQQYTNKGRGHGRDFQNRRNSYTKHGYHYHNNNNTASGQHYNHHPHHNNHHHNQNQNQNPAFAAGAPAGPAGAGGPGGAPSAPSEGGAPFRGPRGYPRTAGHHGHSRGPSFQGPPVYGAPPMMDIPPMYSNMYPVFDSARFGQPPHIPGQAGTPPFVHPQPQAQANTNRKVVMTDANGNPINLKEKLKHTRTSSVGPAGSDEDKKAETVAAKPENVPEFSKSKTSDAALKMKELIAQKRQKRLAEEGKSASKSATESPQPEESKPEPKVDPKVETKVEEPKEELKAEPKEDPKPESKEDAKEEPKAEPKAEATPVESKAEPTSESKPVESTPEAKPETKSAEPETKLPGPGKWVPPFLRRKMEAEAAAKASGAEAEAKPAAEESKPAEAAKPAEEKPAAAEAAAEATPESTPAPETTAAPASAPAAEGEAASESASPAPASAESKAEDNTAKSEKFRAQHNEAHHLTSEEVNTFKYPSNVLANPEAGKAPGFRYSPDFLVQFAEKVPRLYYDTFRPVIGFDYESGITRWNSGAGKGGSGFGSRGPSRSGSHVGFGGGPGGPGGRGSGGGRNGGGSMRGRNSSRRKGDRQGSRRDRDDASNISAADLPPLHTVENAWTPSFLKKKEAEEKANEDDGRLSPEEVQRKVKSLLNKMAWENFEQIASQIREIALQSINENNAFTLRQVIQLTFDKAIDEPHWSEIYAAFFLYLHMGEGAIPPEVVDESDPEKKLTGVPVLRRYLLNMSQQEFEKGWGEIAQLSGNVAMLSDEYYAAIALKRRGLGLTQLIGEMLKKSLVSEKLVMGCFARLANEEPTEDIVESMSKLIRTVATTMIRQGQGNVVDMAMAALVKWKESGNLPARLRFKIMDMEDLQRKKWAGVDDSNGPKTIAQVHLDALKKEQEAEREKAMKSRQGSRRGGDFGRSGSGRGRR